jgi:hypothetical protein
VSREKGHGDPRLSGLLVRNAMTGPAPTLSAGMTFADSVRMEWIVLRRDTHTPARSAPLTTDYRNPLH